MEWKNQAFHTIGQASTLTGLSMAWLKKEGKAGRIPFVQQGKSMMFDVAEVRKALNAVAASEAKARRGDIE